MTDQSQYTIISITIDPTNMHSEQVGLNGNTFLFITKFFLFTRMFTIIYEADHVSGQFTPVTFELMADQKKS